MFLLHPADRGRQGAGEKRRATGPGWGVHHRLLPRPARTEALTFGNLLDPESRVAKLIQDPRAYQVLAQLNTKPAVIYLKKIIAEDLKSVRSRGREEQSKGLASERHFRSHGICDSPTRGCSRNDGTFAPYTGIYNFRHLSAFKAF